MYSLSVGLYAGGRSGPVVVYVRRDEFGGGAATAAVGGSGRLVVRSADPACSVPLRVAKWQHSRLVVRGGAVPPGSRLCPAEVRQWWQDQV